LLLERSNTFDYGAVGYMNWLDWRAAQRSFTDLVLARREGFNFSAGTEDATPTRVRGLRASANVLAVLGLKPVIGRGFTEAENQAGSANVALIGEDFWRTNFGAASSVLGR